MSLRLYLAGAGGFGRELAQELRGNSHYSLLGFLDDQESFWGQSFAGVSVVGGLAAEGLDPEACVVVSVAQPEARKHIVASLAAHHRPFTALILGCVQEGCVIGNALIQSCAVVSTGCRIGDHSCLAFGVAAGHDTTIGEYVHVGNGAFIAGECQIGDGVLIEPRACIARGVQVADGAHIGMGAVVLRDVPAGVTVLGNPARTIR